MARIFVIDDEQDLCEILRFNLEGEGFEVRTATSAEEALSVLRSEEAGCFDLLLLDVMMDQMSGFDLVRRLRAMGDNTPVIFLTARTAEADQLEGFGVGADDYINKPFSFSTVLARVRAVLKRSVAPDSGRQVLRSGSLELYPDVSAVYMEGKRLMLTKKEYLILLLLLQNKGCHFSREQILAAVWEDEVCVGDRSVDVHIARLRRKLGEMGTHIVNRTGFGYAYYD